VPAVTPTLERPEMVSGAEIGPPTGRDQDKVSSSLTSG
jgi:hypothetical protein